jgi:hypothetical protein
MAEKVYTTGNITIRFNLAIEVRVKVDACEWLQCKFSVLPWFPAYPLY